MLFASGATRETDVTPFSGPGDLRLAAAGALLAKFLGCQVSERGVGGMPVAVEAPRCRIDEGRGLDALARIDLGLQKLHRRQAWRGLGDAIPTILEAGRVLFATVCGWMSPPGETADDLAGTRPGVGGL